MTRLPHGPACLAWLAVALACAGARAAPRPSPATLDPGLRTDLATPLAVPGPGAWDLRVVSPRVLELWRVDAVPRDGWPAAWDWARGDRADLPPAASLAAAADGKALRVESLGLRRRPLYAPPRRRDLRVGTSLFVRLSADVPEGARVSLRNPAGDVWRGGRALEAVADPLRTGPALHASAVGHAPGDPKRVAVGLWMGTLGELPVKAGTPFRVVEAAGGRTVLEGALTPRTEAGFEDMDPPGREVREADFTALRQPGTYRVVVPGLGASPPVRVDEGVPALVARTLALGLYHQRCGAPNELPFTRFVHGACHRAPAQVQDRGTGRFDERLEGLQEGQSPEDQRAPILDRASRALFPPAGAGPVDVQGGHHDAGDYGKYVPQGAALVHALVLAVDAFPGAGELDALGLPESGDGVPDLLQEAAWEADFLARMQDADGGFFTMVLPRDRAYEDDVLPDRGDPQAVFPKNTAATAAAVAALAQAGSSPAARRHLPDRARAWLEAARRGWAFLERAFARHGRDGAYQRVFHYGHVFQDRDEVAWAALELLLATGEEAFAEALRQEAFEPGDRRRVRKWQWVPLTEGFGAATRSCALADRTGRPGAKALEAGLASRCRDELRRAGDELASWSLASAWRTSFPLENKRHRTGAWHFSPEQAFDLEAAALVAGDRPDLREAALANLDYALGANPVDVTFVTGLGRRRPRNVVSQYALNDGRALPPTGLLVGDVTAGFSWTPEYGRDLGRLVFPPDGDRKARAPYPLYDRWGDTWNVQAEATIVAQGRALGAAAARMARGAPSAPVPPPALRIEGVPDRVAAGRPVTARLQADGAWAGAAEVVWEASGQEPSLGESRTFVPEAPGPAWIEAEATWPDGRRAAARRDFAVERRD